jgi:Predicted oxidoreductase
VFDHRVEALTRDGGRVSGCRGTTEGSREEFVAQADAVLVAAGGINGSMERVRAHWHADWGSPPETILNGSHRFADGTLHDAVAAAGGNVTNLDRMWNYAAGVHHWKPRHPGHGLSLVPPRSALWLNWRGERIEPALVTGFDTRDLVTQVCGQERQYSWQLLNRRDRGEGARGVGRGVQSVDPRQVDRGPAARDAVRQPPARRGPDAQLHRFRDRAVRCPSWWKG